MREFSTKDIDGYVAIDVQVQPVLPRVPAQVREGKRQIYDPVLVSLGPYHHGDSRFQEVEDLKADIVAELFSHGRDQKLLEGIQAQSREIRNFYGGIDEESINDEALARMMLRDASFLVYCLWKMAGLGGGDCTVLRRLGMSRLAFVLRDFFMLENQLPFSVLKKAVASTCGDEFESIDAFFHEKIISIINCCDPNFGGRDLYGEIPKFEKAEHLLDACRTTLVHQQGQTQALSALSGLPSTFSSGSVPVHQSTTNEAAAKEQGIHCWPSRSNFYCLRAENPANPAAGTDLKKKGIHFSPTRSNLCCLRAANPAKSQFRSVMDLKAKGIHFRPTRSSSYCLRDVEFKSHSFYGKLRLPIVLLDNKTSVVFSNIIAMEMAPGSYTDFAVTSYVKFMKSLIMKGEDVKELREKGILVSCLANDEEVVKMFQELNTEGSCRKDIFRGVRERINEHCRSKTKTFKAELLHTYFRSPWTTIALLAAILILCVNCLNFLLNYYKFSLSRVNRG